MHKNTTCLVSLKIQQNCFDQHRAKPVPTLCEKFRLVHRCLSIRRSTGTLIGQEKYFLGISLVTFQVHCAHNNFFKISMKTYLNLTQIK